MIEFRISPHTPVVLCSICYAFSSTVCIADNIPFADHMRLGLGIDVRNYETKIDCIEFQISDFPGGLRIQDETKTGIRKSEIFRTLNVGARAVANIGVGAIAGQLDLLRESQINNYSANISRRVIIDAGRQIVISPRIKDELLPLVTQDTQLFYERCGNGYISSIDEMASFIGYGFFNTTSESQKREVELAAGFRAGTVEVDAALASKYEAIAENTVGKIDILRIGSGASNEETTTGTISEVIAPLNRFADEFDNLVVEAGGRPATVAVAPYSLTLNWPDDVPPPLEQFEDNLGKLSAYYLRLEDLRADVDYILQNRDRFAPFSGEVPNISLVDRIDGDMQAIVAEINRCKSQDVECDLVEQNVDVDRVRSSLPSQYFGECPVDQMRLALPSASVMNLSRKGGGGNGDMDNPRVSIITWLRTIRGPLYGEPNLIVQLDREVLVRITEKDGGPFGEDEFSGSTFGIVFDVERDRYGCMLSPQADHLPALDAGIVASADVGDDLMKPVILTFPGGSLVESALCLTDTDGDDDNDLYCDEIVFRDARLTLYHVEDFLPDYDLAGNWPDAQRVRGRVPRSGSALQGGQPIIRFD